MMTATGGEQGIEIFKQERPPVVFTDLKMPGMDGISVMKALKKIDEETEVIFITGYADGNSAMEFLKIGASDFLLKPLDLACFKIMAERALAKQKMKREIRKARKFNRDIIDSAIDGIIVADPKGNIIDSNPALSNLLDIQKKSCLR